MPIIGPDATRLDRAATTLEARLGHDRFEQLTAAGAALGDDAAIAYARQCSLEDRTTATDARWHSQST
jgi:hypothetical protein